MRMASETGCFPYKSDLVCFMEVEPDGGIMQLHTKAEKRNACMKAMDGWCRIYAVWPGQWRSDLFLVDDLAAFGEAYGL